MLMPDGARYLRNYENGKKIEEGSSTYDGEFLENNIHCNGKYVWKNGRVYVGEWQKSKMAC